MIQTERIQAALELAKESEKPRIRLAAEAYAKTLREYKAKFTTANLRNWKAAESELEAILDEVEGGFDDDDGEGHIRRSFSTLVQVHEYLEAEGWKAAQSTVYKHSKAGFIRPDSEGRYDTAEIDRYALKHLKRRDGSRPGEDKQSRREWEARIRKEEAQAQHWETKAKKESGLLVPRELFETELAKRAKILKADLLSFCRSQGPEIVDLVEGNAEKVPDLIQHMVDQVLDALNRYTMDSNGLSS